MNKYSHKWYDLDQFIGLCLDEDMMDFYPSLTCRESANLAIRDFFVTQPRAQIAQVRLELMQLLAERHSEAELEAILLDMGNAWDFSPYRDFLNSVLVQIEESLGIHRPPPATGQQPPAPPSQSVHPRETLKPNWSIGQFFLFLGAFALAAFSIAYLVKGAAHLTQQNSRHETDKPGHRSASVLEQIQGKWYWDDGGYIKIGRDGECFLSTEGGNPEDHVELKTTCRLQDNNHFALSFPDSWDSGQMANFEIADLSKNTLRLVRPNDIRVLHRSRGTSGTKLDSNMGVMNEQRQPSASNGAELLTADDLREWSLSFYEGPSTSSIPHRFPVARFPKSKTRFVWWFVQYGNARGWTVYEGNIYAKWYSPNGNVMGEQVCHVYIPKEFLFNHCSMALGSNTPGSFQVGFYKLIVSVQGKEVARGAFEIYDDAGAAQ